MNIRKKAQEINIKYDMPTRDVAMQSAKNSLKRGKEHNVGCEVIIHGYGSSGKGGVIRSEFRRWINSQLKKGIVKTVIYGEDFSIFNAKALELKNKYEGLDYLLKVCNHGVTVVEL